MSTFTPGPWKADRLLVEAPDGNVALTNLARANEADARLIAAAPDLLEALIRCERHIRSVTGALDGSDSEEICNISIAAIAKAEGK